MYLLFNFKYVKKCLTKKLVGSLIIFLLLLLSVGPTLSSQNLTSASAIDNQTIISSTNRSPRVISFTDSSIGLPSSGEYNFIAFGDINGDSEIDIAFGGEDYQGSTKGVYAYTGNGGTSWSSSSTNLWTGNSWGGLALVDADEDGYTELYAPDEKWGTDNSSGLKVWEYRSGSWIDATAHVSTPYTIGTPDNVLLTNITGDDKLDMVLCTQSGLKYYQNDGGNPVVWTELTTGLPTTSEYTGLAVADMNKDGLEDIIASDYSELEHLFIQQPAGNLWAEHSTGLTGQGAVIGIAVGDVNNDTHMDIMFGTSNNGLKCWLGNSGGGSGGTAFSWTDASNNLATNERYAQIQLVDIDLDDDLDLIAPVGTGGKGIEIYLGDGNTNPGTNMGWVLATNTNLTDSGDWYGCNCYDINKDSYLDIVAASWGDGIKAYLNDLSQDLDQTPPGAVVDLNITNVTSSTITINWTAPADNDTDPGSGPVQSYDIRYSTSNMDLGNWDSATKITGVPIPFAPGTPQWLVLTGLSLNTKYYVALRSLDERPNISPLSNVVNATTLGLGDTIPPGQVIDLQAIEPTKNSINLTWSAPADNGNNFASGPVTGYEIRYHSVEITDATWLSATIFSQSMSPQSPGTQEQITITGLQDNSTYYFALIARDEEANWGLVSNSPFNTTLLGPDVIPPAAIDDLMAVNITTTTLNLTWTAPGDDGSAGTAAAYDIRYAEVGITTTNWDSITQISTPPTPNSAGNSEIFLVTGLKPNTTYYFAVITRDEVPNWSPLSNIASGTTLASILPLMTADLSLYDSTLESAASTTLIITVHDLESNQSIENATVELSSDPSGLMFTPTVGQTGSKGVLTVVIQAPEVTSSTVITIFINITKSGYALLDKQVKLTVVPAAPPIPEFNLQITPGQISFSKATFYDGDEIKIYANISNLGPDESTGFSVRFLVDGNQLGVDITISTLNPGSFVLLNTAWSAREGTHIIRIELYPVDQDYEMDDSNNIAEKTITVNQKTTNGDGNGAAAPDGWIWMVIIIIVVVAILILLLIFGKRKRDAESSEEGLDTMDVELNGLEQPEELEEMGADGEPVETSEGFVDIDEYEEEFIPDPDQDFEPEFEQPPAEEPVPGEEPISESELESETVPEEETTPEPAPETGLEEGSEAESQDETQDVKDVEESEGEEGESQTSEENIEEETEKSEIPRKSKQKRK